MLSEIEPEIVKDMRIESFKKMKELEKELDLAGKSVLVIPYGGYVLPQNSAVYDRLNGEFRAK